MELSEKFGIAREFAIDSNYDCPMETYEIDCLCEGMKPTEIIEKFGSVDINYPYFMPGVYGSESMDDAKLDEWCDDTLEDALQFKDPDYFECWDYEEFCEWISDEYGEDIYDIFSRNVDFPYSSDYHTHAEQFARRWDVDLEILGCEYKKHFIDDKEKRHVFKCKLTNKDGEEYEFEFGQSLSNGSAEPDMYDILSCLTKSDPCTYEDFCSESGYDGGEYSLEVYSRVCDEWEAVLRLFGPEDGKCFEELCEIC